MEKTKNIPKIRFKGYKDEWEKISLSKRADFLKGYGYKKDDLKQFGNEIILYGKMYTDYKTAYASSDTFAEINSKSVLSKTGDVIVPASGETAEDISIASAILKNGIILGGDLNIIRPKNCLDSIFLAISISSGETKKKLTKMAEGATIAHLRNNNLKKVNLFAPSCEEQKQIGSLFKNLDEKLEIEREKHEKLVNFKKAMLENVFPKEGEKRPKIRFGSYNDDWEEIKLEKAFNMRSAKSKVPYIIDNGKYLIMDMGSVSEEGYNISYKRTNLIEDLLKIDDLVMPKDDIGGGKIIGRTAYIDKNDKYVLSDHVYLLNKITDDIYPLFVHYQINSNFFNKHVKRITTGSAQLGITWTNIKEINIYYPKSINEQKLIGSFFKNLDEKIQVSEEKITKIENFKKATMDGLFV